jgi:hypothetical protein
MCSAVKLRNRFWLHTKSSFWAWLIIRMIQKSISSLRRYSFTPPQSRLGQNSARSGALKPLQFDRIMAGQNHKAELGKAEHASLLL